MVNSEWFCNSIPWRNLALGLRRLQLLEFTSASQGRFGRSVRVLSGLGYGVGGFPFNQRQHDFVSADIPEGFG